MVIGHDGEENGLVDALADEVEVLHQGRTLAKGSLAQVRSDPHVASVHAGGGAQISLQLDRISGGHGDTLIHRNLPLTLPAGQITAIAGRNGTGKTTLASLIAGALPLAAGTIRLDDRDIGPLLAFARAARHRDHAAN